MLIFLLIFGYLWIIFLAYFVQYLSPSEQKTKLMSPFSGSWPQSRLSTFNGVKTFKNYQPWATRLSNLRSGWKFVPISNSRFEMDQYFPTKATDLLYLELFVDFLFAIVPPLQVLNLGGNLIGLLPERGVNIWLTTTAFSGALDMPRLFF